jgi:hypothetical protein
MLLEHRDGLFYTTPTPTLTAHKSGRTWPILKSTGAHIWPTKQNVRQPVWVLYETIYEISSYVYNTTITNKKFYYTTHTLNRVYTPHRNSSHNIRFLSCISSHLWSSVEMYSTSAVSAVSADTASESAASTTKSDI